MSRRMPARKRARADYAGKQSAATRAMFANMYTSKKYPYSSYGRQYIPKGTFLSQAGRTYASATPAQRAWRRSNNYHGMGMYTGDGMYTGSGGFWKDLGRGWRRLAKSKLGRGVRHAFTRELGDLAETIVPGSRVVSDAALKAAGIGMYTGGGAYKAVKNDLIEGGHMSEGIMRFDVQDDEDAILISHSEYVMDVYAPPEGVNKSDIKLPLNVGESTTFPMLSQLAANFEDYEIVQLGFTYKPTLSDWQTTTGQVGQILMATNYNPNAQLWTSKQQMLAQTGSTSARTIDCTLHGIECDKSKMHNDGHYLVRTGPPRLNTNLSDFDHGWTQLSVVDMPAGTGNKTLGELHVSYTIKLSKPRIWTGIANAVPRAMAVKQNPGSWVSPGGPTLTVDQHLGDPFVTDIMIPSAQYAEDIYKARQGNIPFKFDTGVSSGKYAGAHQWARCTLPAQFTGDIKFTVKLQYQLTLAGGSGLQHDPALLLVDLQGQVEPILDSVMLIGGASRNFSGSSRTIVYHAEPERSILQIGTYSNGDAAMVFPLSLDAREEGGNEKGIISAEGHFRIAVARDQVDNVISFALAAPSNGYASDVTVNGLCIEMEAYNTRLNYRQDGTNDKVILIDKADQVVTY